MSNDESGYSKANPLITTIKVNDVLTHEDSDKEIRHVVFDLPGPAFNYVAGDAVGVYVYNDKRMVRDTLALAKISPDSLLTKADGSQIMIADELLEGYALNRVTKKFVTTLASLMPAGEKKTELEEACAADIEEFISGKDYIDFLVDYPEAVFTPDLFVSTLGKLNLRLYSISSSPLQHPTEIHMAIAIVEHELRDRVRYGMASGHLFRAKPGEIVAIYPHTAKHFRLPADKGADIIMIGAGTGGAPYRAFLQERKLSGATGRNWLIFGCKARALDYLYGTDFEAFEKEGTLHRFTPAFSREQEHKIYVQDKIREHGAQIWDWINNGAFLYVCGDAKKMAKDVHQALIDVAAAHGGLSPADATQFISNMAKGDPKRYMRDVY